MAGIFAQQHPEDVLTVKATQDVEAFTFVNLQSGAVGTSTTQKLGIAQHAAKAGEVVTVAVEGLCAVRVGTGFNFVDNGTAVKPRYTFSGTMTSQYITPGTSGLGMTGSSGYLIAQDEWAAPPDKTGAQLANIIIF